MARDAGGRGSGDGIDRAVLAAGVGDAGTGLATARPCAGGRRSVVGRAASGAGAVEPGGPRPQARLSGRRTVGEAARRTGTDPEFRAESRQRLWRTVTRRKYQLTCARVQLQNRLEALLEEAHIKLSSLVADLLGPSARRMLNAIAEGATDPAAVAALAHQRMRATPEALCDALGACRDLHPVYRRLLQLALHELRGIEAQIDALNQELAGLLRAHQEAVERLAAVPGLGVDSAQQIIAEVGADARTFSAPKQMSSWVGVCPWGRG